MTLLEKLISEEENLKEFIAPVVSPGHAQTHIRGIVKTFKVLPIAFEGWALLKPDNFIASVQRDAAFDEKMQYLDRLPYLRMTLIKRLRNSSFLAMPFNFSDASKRFGIKEPKIVHLVENCMPFDQVIASIDGEVLWFKDTDERADFEIAERLRNAKLGQKLNEKNLTPEQIQAFKIFHKIDEQRKAQTLESRLERALSVSGAKLVEFEDGRVDSSLNVTWEWEGEEHTVTINRDNFRVISAGFCIESMDEKYDLTSIVSVWRDKERW